MPKIFEYLGIYLFLWSDDHLPMHFHARHQKYEMVIEVIFKNGKPTFKYKTVKGREPFPPAKLTHLKKFVKAYYRYMVRKWELFYIYGYQVKSEKVKDLKGLNNED
ncbi:MAG: DUF4160 domain-containing protein [Bacteroidetes bacterium]|nr:DUF4160 domain-containing protein [Bacteroidota bacterium]